MKLNFEEKVKLGLALLLFLCLLNMPYGYYQFVRLAALVGFVFLALNADKKGNSNGKIIYICLALLFQPILKISLGRDIWNIIDVVVGLGLIVFLKK